MNNLKNENYITILGFMVNELKLKGNELLVYAIIYGFSQSGEHKYTGSLQYLADWTNSTKQGVIKVLKSLISKEYIKKDDYYLNGVKFVSYYTTKFNGGMQLSCTNNTNIYIKENIFNSKELNIKEKEQKKQKFGTYQRVLLTQNEYDKLCNDFTKDVIDKQIELLDEYVESNNNKNGYKNFNLVLRKSIREEWFKSKLKPKIENEYDFLN